MSSVTSRDGLRLGRLWGIPIYLAYSWFIIAAFTVVTFGPMLAGSQPALGFGAYVVAFMYAVLLLLSVLAHELAHALTAMIFGWASEKIVLNLWGGHTQFTEFKATPWRSVLVAFAGPVANFVLAGLGWLVATLTQPDGVAGILLWIFTWANFVIAIFNVLPGLPLDGGRLVETIVWTSTGNREKGTIAAGWAGRIIVVLIVLYFIVRPFLLGEGLDFKFAIITLLVAGFLWMGASEAIRVARMRGRLPSIRAAQLAEPAYGVPQDLPVAQLFSAARPGTAFVIIAPDGSPQAVVDPSAVAAVPAGLLPTTPVSAVSVPLAPGAYVPDHAAGKELIDYLSALDGNQYAVVDSQGRVTGLLRQATVVAALTGRPEGPGRAGTH
ncbi:site-2 protease family protein [Arthrobacter woluwensis]|uniref:site-2 protease family protein n=1 Tax=Arthrobacter woluwensis TaxID=156980 RepID=UPI001FB93C99|nr:site-2 protease family protein [Arthrobacter woluwensis]